MHRNLNAFAIFAFIVSTAAAIQAQVPSQQMQINRRGETIVLEPYAPNIVRVTLSLQSDAAKAAPGFGIVAKPAEAGWKESQTEQADVYASDRMVVTVAR